MPTQTNTRADQRQSDTCASTRSLIGPRKSTSSSIANEPNAAKVARSGVVQHLGAEREHGRHHDRGPRRPAQRGEPAVPFLQSAYEIHPHIIPKRAATLLCRGPASSRWGPPPRRWRAPGGAVVRRIKVAGCPSCPRAAPSGRRRRRGEPHVSPCFRRRPLIRASRLLAAASAVAIAAGVTALGSAGPGGCRRADDPAAEHDRR